MASSGEGDRQRSPSRGWITRSAVLAQGEPAIQLPALDREDAHVTEQPATRGCPARRAAPETPSSGRSSGFTAARRPSRRGAAARPPFLVKAAVVVESVGDVRWLLNLEEVDAAADGVGAARGDGHRRRRPRRAVSRSSSRPVVGLRCRASVPLGRYPPGVRDESPHRAPRRGSPRPPICRWARLPARFAVSSSGCTCSERRLPESMRLTRRGNRVDARMSRSRRGEASLRSAKSSIEGHAGILGGLDDA